MSKTILIVEDEQNLVELLKYRLEANEYKVETAFDGEEGLKKIKKVNPDLVILDIMMPKMHGYDVCRLAKEDKKTKNIPIIILTARAQNKDITEAMDCGADAFLSKPFEPAVLLKKVKELIG